MGGAVSLVGEVCELERYELEFLRMPTWVSVTSDLLASTETYPLAARYALRASAFEASVPSL
jgi:hypothetical protein